MRLLLMGPAIDRDLDVLKALIETEARWFEVDRPINWHADSADEWFAAAREHGRLIGFGGFKRGKVGTVDALAVFYGVLPSQRRRGYGSRILKMIHTKALDVAPGVPVIAGVFADNAPSQAVCRKFFGAELYEGTSASGRSVVVFGDLRAARALDQAGYAVRVPA